MSSDYFEVVWDYDIYEHMDKYKDRVHIIHGDRDTDVPKGYSERATEEFPNAELTVLEDQGHVPNLAGYNVVVEALVNRYDKGEPIAFRLQEGQKYRR